MKFPKVAETALQNLDSSILPVEFHLDIGDGNVHKAGVRDLPLANSWITSGGFARTVISCVK
jgi:hypothetical protein